MMHRLGALLLLTVLAWLVWRLMREPALRRHAAGLVGVAAWQVVTGISNVVLDWPLLAAVAHTGGAAALVLLLTALVLRTASTTGVAAPSRTTAPLAAQRAS